jgi:hypothetical protein
MPEISRFYGISVYIYYDDHNPPHFHAIYNKSKVIISIETLGVIAGKFPPRALGMLIEWATINQNELREVWSQASNYEKLSKIEPLK